MDHPRHQKRFTNISNGLILEYLGPTHCKGLRQYPFEYAAFQAGLVKYPKQRFVTYHCKHCGKWHVSLPASREAYEVYVNQPYTDNYQKSSHYKWVCNNTKKKFKTNLSAQTYIIYYGLQNVFIYPCPCCKFWHIGHRYRR